MKWIYIIGAVIVAIVVYVIVWGDTSSTPNTITGAAQTIMNDITANGALQIIDRSDQSTSTAALGDTGTGLDVPIGSQPISGGS